MPERIIEIIVFALSKLRNDLWRKDYSDLTNELISKGYTESEINLSFSWIYNHLTKSTSYNDEKGDLVYWDEPESNETFNNLLSDEAYFYLLQMVQLGILNDYQVEQIFEKALTSGNENVNADQVKSLVVNVLFDSDKNKSALSSYYFNRDNNHLQ